MEYEDVATVAEVGRVLADYETLVCAPSVGVDGDGLVSLTVRVRPGNQQALNGQLAVLELLNRLRHVCDVALMRALAAKFDIPAEDLERLIPKE